MTRDTRDESHEARAGGTPTDGARADGAGAGADGDATDVSADGRKERVLHTRVPAVLEKELKRFAENLRIPVSNLVRTILEDALQVADAASENVESRLKKAAQQLEVERERLRARVKLQPLKDVFAFQTVTLAQAVSCAACGKDLEPGQRAHMGLTDDPPGAKRRPRAFVCDDCLPKGTSS